jgi:diguanylate cyclase (GGDEF)-like protein
MGGEAMPLFLTAEPAAVVRTALAAALDLVDFGVVLLNPAMQPRFLNRHFVTMWALPDDLLAPGTTFRQLLDHVGNSCAYHVSPADVAAYIDQREGAVRDGTVAPTVIDLTDGRRILFRCVIAADGSRILTYIDITRQKQEQDIQQHARDAAERNGVELRFSNESLESQAAYLASLAEAADAAAQRADQAKRRLEHEMTEQQALEAQLRRMATTDALTGAMNPAQLLTLGQRELERVRTTGQELAVVMLGIDHFESINDRYGHPCGDEVLRNVVGQLSSCVRRIDLVGRLGGKEFAVILPAIPATTALRAAERLRSHVADTAIVFGDATIRLTVSIGVAMARDTDRSIEQALARADAALSTARGAGRNRVVSCDEVEPVA